eukprot:2688520-Alexandrium_andersonii.AAC.1
MQRSSGRTHAGSLRRRHAADLRANARGCVSGVGVQRCSGRTHAHASPAERMQLRLRRGHAAA